MSWSEDTRCLYCDGKLPLYRKITSGQFCSAAHGKAYWQEQERLAVERLHQTHDSLRAYRPLSPLEPTQQKVPDQNPGWSPVASPAPAPRQPVAEFVDGPTVEERARSASNTGQVRFAGFILLMPNPMAATEKAEYASVTDLAFAGYTAEPPSLPALDMRVDESEWETAPAIPVSFFQAMAVGPDSRESVVCDAPHGLLPSSSAGNVPVRIPFAAAPKTPEFDLLWVEDAGAPATVLATTLIEPDPADPVQAGPLALARIASHRGKYTPRVPAQGLLRPFATPLHKLAATVTGSDGYTSMAAPAGLLPLAIDSAPRRHGASGPVTPEPQAMDQGLAPGTPRWEAILPTLAPELRLAPGSRYRMSDRPGVAARGERNKPFESPRLLDFKSAAPLLAHRPELEPGLAAECRYLVSFEPRPIEPAGIRPAVLQAMGASTRIAICALPDGVRANDPAPVFPRLRPLAFEARPKTPPAAQPVLASLLPLYPERAPLMPRANGEPIEGALQPPPRAGLLAGWQGVVGQMVGTSEERKHLWAHAADFWHNAPRDLKLLAIAIPVLLGLALRPSLPKVQVKAPAVRAAGTGSLERSLQQGLLDVRRNLADRAGVALNEDFRTGLDDWQSRGDLSAAWSFDRNGFVKPGVLALYRPSMNLSDYEMEFLGLIDKKALSWVVRAADFDNFYVIKLVVLKPGPMPTLGITRYAVIHGQAQNRVDTLAAINARTDMLYRVNLNVRGDTYLLTLQGKVVDTWSEPRLGTGGIGFFSQQGEESRLRWVQVTHQYDMLGRLCAYLAPYDNPKTNRSW